MSQNHTAPKDISLEVEETSSRELIIYYDQSDAAAYPSGGHGPYSCIIRCCPLNWPYILLLNVLYNCQPSCSVSLCEDDSEDESMDDGSSPNKLFDKCVACSGSKAYLQTRKKFLLIILMLIIAVGTLLLLPLFERVWLIVGGIFGLIMLFGIYDCLLFYKTESYLAKKSNTFPRKKGYYIRVNYMNKKNFLEVQKYYVSICLCAGVKLRHEVIGELTTELKADNFVCHSKNDIVGIFNNDMLLMEVTKHRHATKVIECIEKQWRSRLPNIGINTNQHPVIPMNVVTKST